MRQARKKLADAEPYFYKLQAEIARILRHMPEVSNQYFDSREEIPKEERKIGSVVITGDKGLAGAYNHNVEEIRYMALVIFIVSFTLLIRVCISLIFAIH